MQTQTLRENGGVSTAQLLRELRDETTQLLRQEVQLAKTEMSEKTSRAASNVGQLSVGALVLHIGAIFLLLAVAGSIPS